MNIKEGEEKGEDMENILFCVIISPSFDPPLLFFACLFVISLFFKLHCVHSKIACAGLRRLWGSWGLWGPDLWRR